ncbi:hypothetical protein ACH79_17425 [Bradyrhizobium sp. CCBAU 051011]|uniref:hypothetical protein n=1 Tax=Bradyrhizobium sp. CCBAU 051011 TaxID=858422 RepID=UPI001373AD84|nr:hypothetical protein [Bradyrhizobium sp. CCBAU 051011]QHO74149.1 hypothetical protein ACH79_17425 [Bradyrhizobium sp. CCBAU 051011]
MSRAPRFLAIVLFLLCGASPAYAAQDAPLERGAAITDPVTLRELDGGKFRLDRLLLPERSSDTPLANSELFAVPLMTPVRQAIDGEFDRYIAWHRANLAKETIGVGEGFDFQLFDRTLLYSAETRFVLAGIVNRMDRTYAAEASCGEIRLIYRLTRMNQAAGDHASPPRLPMTLNLVLKAKGEGEAITCPEIAARWLAAPLAGTDLIRHENIDRIETNLQIAHAPKSAVRDFRTDYLLKVFRYDQNARAFAEAPMENQIDRARLLADDGLKREFRAWLLDPINLAAFDLGTVLIPEKFLAQGAIAPTPVGFDPSDLEPEFGLVQGEGAVFSEADVVAALRKVAEGGGKLQNIRSLAGFERRLNDVTCSGCHQTRGIGGFHFPGVDWMADKPSNSTVVPGSPHFFGDQIRRRDILASLRDGKQPDYSRGFASRPQLRGSTELAGTNYYDGWGAHCYVQARQAANNDASFRDWTCAEGLSCQAAGKISRIGMCFVKGR